jgi:hypothetical protein
MSDGSISEALTSAVRTVLRPLVRLMLARGVTLPLAVELLKRVYVQVALEGKTDGGSSTDSRVSMLTGVHRKDVKRLRGLPDASAELPRVVSLGAQLVSVWTTRPGWVDEQGRPLALPRLGSAGGDRSFDALVACVSKDIRARPVLDEWLRLGVVHLNDRDEVVLNTAAFVPQAGFDEKLSYLSLNVGDHALAAIENTLGRADPWFERSVHYRGMTEESVTKLRAQASELGMQSLQILNTEAQRVSGAPDPGAGSQPEDQAADQRFTFGVYFYAERADEKKEG